MQSIAGTSAALSGPRASLARRVLAWLIRADSEYRKVVSPLVV